MPVLNEVYAPAYHPVIWSYQKSRLASFVTSVVPLFLLFLFPYMMSEIPVVRSFVEYSLRRGTNHMSSIRHKHPIWRSEEACQDPALIAERYSVSG